MLQKNTLYRIYKCRYESRLAIRAYNRGVTTAQEEYILYDNIYNHDIKYPTITDLVEKHSDCKLKKKNSYRHMNFYEQGYYECWTDLLHLAIIKRCKPD